MKSRICCFCESWDSGGIESFLRNLLCSMDLSQMEIDLVAADVQDSIFTEALEQRGVRLIQLTGHLRSAENFKRFRQLLRERHYDAIHFNLFQGLSLLYVRIAREEGVPIRIAHSHGAGLRNSATKSLKLVIHRLGRMLWAKEVTERWACSHAAGQFLFGSTDRLQIVPNGIDVERFRFSPEARGKMRGELGLDQQLLVGTVGRLSGEKNHAFLLDVFSEILQQRPDSRLIFVGEGDSREALKRKARELGISQSVIFYGVSRRVEDILSAMDVFVFPSLVEGLGIACIEAQASGLPVLCSENIPEETKVAPTVQVMSLREGAHRWAEKIMELADHQPRYDGVSAIRSAGYDSAEVACWVRARYVGADDE